MDNSALISTLLSQVDTDLLKAELAKREGAKRKLKPLTERERLKNYYKELLKKKLYFNGKKF